MTNKELHSAMDAALEKLLRMTNEEFVRELNSSKESSLCAALISTRKFEGFDPNLLLSTSLSVPLATDIGHFSKMVFHDNVVHSNFSMAA